MVLKEDGEQLAVGDDRGIKGHHHDFIVIGKTRADLLVGRIRRFATLVARGGDVDARCFVELALGAPEAAHAKVGQLNT